MPRELSQSPRAVRRRAKYQQARAEGFSPSEARGLRDIRNARTNDRVWSKWSDTHNPRYINDEGEPDSFPRWARKIIDDYNKGRDPNAQYGYRRAYAKLVLGIKDLDKWYHDEYIAKAPAIRRDARLRRRTERRELRKAA